MSWNPIDITDLDLHLVDNKISWTCPRCGHRQTFFADHEVINSLLYGLSIKCQNIDVCGEDQSYFELRLTVDYGGYKGLNDQPLTVPANQTDPGPFFTP